VLAALNPAHAVGIFVAAPGAGFVALGAVALAITGGEALYADMGHFGRFPIRLAWFMRIVVRSEVGEGGYLTDHHCLHVIRQCVDARGHNDPPARHRCAEAIIELPDFLGAHAALPRICRS